MDTGRSSSLSALLMSRMLVRVLVLTELCRRKYFCAWLATCVGVRVNTQFLDMFRQSPLPYLSSPRRNSLCHQRWHIMIDDACFRWLTTKWQQKGIRKRDYAKLKAEQIGDICWEKIFEHVKAINIKLFSLS